MRFGFRTALCAASVTFCVDALAVALHAEPQASPLAKLWLLLQAIVFLSGFAVLAAALLAVLVRGLSFGLRPLRELLGDTRSFGALDFGLGAFPALSLWSLALYVALLEVPRRFRNAELAALLIVLSALGLGLGLLAAASWLAGWSGRSRQRSRRLFLATCVVPSVLIGAGAWGFILYDNRAGFAQLDGWFLASVLAAPFAYFAWARYGARWELASRGRRRGLWALGLALLASLLGTVFPWEVVALVARGEGVGRAMVAGLRAATDVDRDGYSSLLAGGDCAPFNARVHPEALEVPRDGIDNNCFGGDSGGISKLSAPKWLPVPAGVPTRPNVLLITVETLRADRVSFLGHEQPTTPKLAEYAANAYVFENFFATTPWTRLSLPAILSSRGPTRLNWESARGGSRLAPNNPWLPALFQQQGYDTIAVLTSLSAFTSKEAIGFDRGFGTYDTTTRVTQRGGTMRGFPGQQQAKVVRRHLEHKRAKPFFLWVHLLEPHYAYERSNRAPEFGTDKQGLYASEIWEVDAVIGTMLADLERLGLDDKTIVVLVGDHGEEFQEHGRNWHGGNLFQPQVHTPALMHVPGLPGGRIREAASHEDLMPTLLNLAGIRAGFERLGGRNLTALLRGERLARDHFFLERYDPANGKGYMAAVVHYPHKLIYTEEGRTFALFDLKKDPDEKHPLPLRGEPFGTLDQLLRQHIDGAQRASQPAAALGRK